MRTETMTIHEALAELKTLDCRIEKETRKIKFCAANRADCERIEGVAVIDFIKGNKSLLQSVQDLICRRIALKRAVAKSNATTQIEIAGETMSVTEAIEYKNHGIELKRTLLVEASSQYERVLQMIARENDRLPDKFEQHLSIMTSGGKDAISTEKYTKLREEYIKNNEYKLVDCVGVKNLIDSLSNEIDAFATKVDAALSKSNAITEITIEY